MKLLGFSNAILAGGWGSQTNSAFERMLMGWLNCQSLRSAQETAASPRTDITDAACLRCALKALHILNLKVSVFSKFKSYLQFTFLGRRLTMMAPSSISMIVKLHTSGIWSKVNQPRVQRCCDQHSQSTPVLWLFDPNRSNIWEDVVDLMHSAYTSKVAISGIASLEFRGLAICLVFNLTRWTVLFPNQNSKLLFGNQNISLRAFELIHHGRIWKFLWPNIWPLLAPEAPFRAHGGPSSAFGATWPWVVSRSSRSTPDGKQGNKMKQVKSSRIHPMHRSPEIWWWGNVGSSLLWIRWMMVRWNNF